MQWVGAVHVITHDSFDSGKDDKNFLKEKVLPRIQAYFASIFILCTSATALLGSDVYASGSGLDATAGEDRGSAVADLAVGFESVPDAAKPRVWWHWMNGNITLDGIDRDLEWMQRTGIGGVQNFDGSLNTPRLVQPPLVYMTESWRNAFKHAVVKADELNLEFAIASSPGWSETGGPWVKPEQAMKKLVWTETDVRGGASLEVTLRRPPDIPGPYQNIPLYQAGSHGMNSQDIPPMYGDTVVVAYRVPEVETIENPEISVSVPVDVDLLTDGGYVHGVGLPFSEDDTEYQWIQFDYGNPVAIRALTMAVEAGPRIGPIPPSWPKGVVEVSDDGLSFEAIAELPQGGSTVQTISFATTVGRYFRVKLANNFAPAFFPHFDRNPEKVREHRIMEVNFHTGARVHRFQDKACWSMPPALYRYPSNSVDSTAAISASEVVDLTEYMSDDGVLRWNVPEGNWRVLRMGWSLTGQTNGPASIEATGLEVDKFNRDHVSAYIEHYLGMYEDVIGKDLIGENGLSHLLNDSFEALGSNWTEDILLEFEARRGYHPLPWLPVLTGKVVGSAADSDRFLWDFRRTLSDLIVDEHYEEISRALETRGMQRYSEAHEGLRAFPGDGMEVKRSADVPMGAQWAGEGTIWNPDLLESASVAHVYGQNLVAAESFTALGNSYNFSPSDLRATADTMMANGVNRFVIHTSVHQPFNDVGPGFGLGPFGQWFTRHETWAEQAHAWISYLSRASYLLQQGRFVADIAWYYGDGTNIVDVYYNRQPPVAPEGFRYDFINGDILRNDLTVQEGVLHSSGSGQYKIIVIEPGIQSITLASLKKLAQLVEQGVTLVGSQPKASPSLADDQSEYAALASRLWGGATSDRVYTSLRAALDATGIAPAVKFSGRHTGGLELMHLHRKLPDADIFFVVNAGKKNVETTASFNVRDSRPIQFDAVTGKLIPLSFNQRGRRTEVPLRLPAGHSVFVVFGEATELSSWHAPAYDLSEVVMIDNPWQVLFDIRSGNPGEVTMPNLVSWPEVEDIGIRYYSGTARYSNTFTLDGISAQNYVLDLGDVHDLAEVTINGRSAGVVWQSPFQVDIGKYVRAGENQLEITVANVWRNRLIGDKQPGSTTPPVRAIFQPFSAEDKLVESGLLGPVKVFAAKQ